jgi:hypothetical protein
MTIGLTVSLMALTSLVACEAAERGTAPETRPTYVVARTPDDVHIGVDLRYKDGQFRLREGDGDAVLPASKVVCVNFLRPDELTKPPRVGTRPLERLPVVVVMALRVAAATRPTGGRLVAARRPPGLPDGIFILREEHAGHAFLRAVDKVRVPGLAAVLCAELVNRCREGGAPQPASLFREAERRVRDRRDVAFVYALMCAAARHAGSTPEENKRALERLVQAYLAHRAEIMGVLNRLSRSGRGGRSSKGK